MDKVKQVRKYYEPTIVNLKKAREKRRLMQKSAFPKAMAYLGFAHSFLENPQFLTGLAIIAAYAAAGKALITIKAYTNAAPSIRRATHNVGSALSKEVKTNSELKAFLGKCRYVYIDGHGTIIGTNRKRILGIGRLRLESNKILTGKY